MLNAHKLLSGMVSCFTVQILLANLYGSHMEVFISVSKFLRKLCIEVGLSRVQVQLLKEVVHIILHFECEKLQ